MAYASFAAYKADYTNPQGVFQWYHATMPITASAWNMFSTWGHNGDQYPTPRGGSATPVVPTTPTVCDATTAIGWIKPIGGSGDQIIVAANLQSKANAGGGLLIDRLSHQGGLVGNVTSTQTTNLPTAALTRYTSGVGVHAALEVYTAVGTTDAVWTVVYTNQAGTGGRSVSFTLVNTPSAQAFIPIPMQGTDTGVRSVESVTLTPSTGTAGNIGVTLYKPQVWIPALSGSTARPLDVFDLPGWNTPIHDDACLQLLLHFGDQQTTNPPDLTLSFGES